MLDLRPDIVITDVRMPQMDGLEMLQQTKNKVPYHTIVLSGFDEFEYAKKAIHLGVSDYLLKPVDLDELKCCLASIKGSRSEHTQTVTQNHPLILPDIDKAKNKYVIIMLQYIREHFSEQISLTDLSQTLNISCTHLNSKFKLEMGYTFHDFLNYYRITQAIELHKQNIK
ncbi:MAG: response regulator [Rikenellaceae bacterium]